ncbi:MAG: YggT family protein [Rhodocyclales bacterium]|nr:YggT family protein [Rhodocyclales bacterium]
MQALAFLLNSVTGFFSALFLLRFLMQAMRVSFAGPLGDVVVKLTNWAVKLLRRFIPGVGGYDWASVVAAFGLQCVLATAFIALAGGLAMEADTIALFILGHSLRNLLRLTVYVFIGALLLQAVLSWINPYSPLARPANQLTAPLLAPFRRIIPPISGIDLSPLALILLLQVVLMYL